MYRKYIYGKLSNAFLNNRPFRVFLAYLVRINAHDESDAFLLKDQRENIPFVFTLHRTDRHQRTAAVLRRTLF